MPLEIYGAARFLEPSSPYKQRDQVVVRTARARLGDEGAAGGQPATRGIKHPPILAKALYTPSAVVRPAEFGNAEMRGHRIVGGAPSHLREAPAFPKLKVPSPIARLDRTWTDLPPEPAQ